jgi:hypothetical protein
VLISSEEALAGGILGTFVIIMIVSLIWLVVAYDLQVGVRVRLFDRYEYLLISVQSVL